jgi:hypothetical protein
MKLLWTTLMASVAAVALTACDQRIPLGPTASASEGTPTFAQSASTNTLVRSSSVQTGNGAPSGGHYSLNIIGVPKGKTASMTGDNGHRIFVPLVGNTKIMLIEGPDFGVLDANGTDGEASFQLPNPDPGGDGVTVYSVFARALGTPGGKSLTTTCATDPFDGLPVCSIATLTLERKNGKSTFQNVSKELLYIYADINGDGILDRVALFDSALQSYFWDYDNTGLKLAQIRFYDCSTTVPVATDPTGTSTTACFQK